MRDPSPEETLLHIARALEAAGQSFAVVGGVAVALRGEPRFTRDVDLALAIRRDADLERLVFGLRAAGYGVAALVEHEARGRLATARLHSPAGLVVDLIAASCGIEAEVVSRATSVVIEEIGPVPVARAEELLAMKILSMTEKRPQDRMDAIGLILVNEQLDLNVVRDDLRLITERGFHRDQDLFAKLSALLDDARAA